MLHRYWITYDLSLKILKSWNDRINWFMRMCVRVIEKRSDDVTKIKFVKSRDRLAYPERTR